MQSIVSLSKIPLLAELTELHEWRLEFNRS